MTLRLRLGLIYLIIASLFAAAAYESVRVFELVTHESDAVIVKDTAMIDGYERLRAGIDGAVKASRLAVTKQEAPDTARSKRGDVDTAMKDLRNRVMPGEASAFGRIEAAWNRIRSTAEAMEVKPRQAGELFRNEILPVLPQLREGIQSAEDARRALSFERVGRIQDAIRKARTHLMFLAALLVLAAAVLVLVVKRYIHNPLEALRRATERVAQGDFEYRIPRPGRKDEMASVIENFNDMNGRLAEAEEMKREFTSIVTHELRTPLTLLKGYAELLEMPPKEVTDEERREAIEIIVRETKMLTELTNDFFDVASARARNFRIDEAPADLSRELGGLLQPFEKLAQKRRIDYQWNVSGLPVVHVDAKRVGQAVRNLVVNAFKFTPAGGRVEVTGKTVGDRIVLETRDNGPGIPAEDLPHLFTRFYQRKQKPGQGRGGVGLGLAIVREIALAHDGNVEVESEEGKGTCFRIVLPFGGNA